MGLMAVALMAMAATTAQAQASLQARLVARPLTPGDISTYKLPASTETSGGLTTVGVGTPVYLEVDVANTIPAADITGVNWVLTSKPLGSAAALTASPLGTNVPVYEPSDRLIYQVAGGAAGRMVLRPDMANLPAGVQDQYTVTATITTASEGITNVSLTITAGTYVGISTCFFCHSGSQELPAYDDKSSWQTTAHSMIFTEGINGVLGHYSQSCLQCHTVGYDTNPSSTNDNGFYAVMLQTGWTFPTNLVPSNWTNMQANYPSLANLANIQCENCHGPGSEHFYSMGNTNLISHTVFSGDCNQCHDAPTHHVKGTEWYNSKHAVTTTDPAGSAGCVICHTAYGFIARISGGPTNLAYAPIGCQTCHEPHGQTIPTNNPHLLRTLANVTLMDGTTVTNAGEGLLCMECHHARQNAATYASTSAGSSHFGPHEGPQADMLEGVNGYTYGLAIPSSAHRDSVTNACITCHMQATASTDPTFLLAGGHTWNMSCSNGGTNYEMVAACAQCHGPITTFNFPREDYDGDGVIEGVQTEVQNLLNDLGALLPPVGQPKSSLSIDSTWTQPQLEAAYNYLMVQKDGSLGVHNVAYTVGLLKASIANLTGGANVSALPASWQIQYFGSTTNAAAAPYADPTGDGVPNWLKYALGLNPNVAGETLTNGVVLANVTALGGATNTVHIYTAAEVVFDTQTNETYQIQAISSLNGGWQNVGSPIQGTGASISYLTSTRQNAQQFYRVVHTP